MKKFLFLLVLAVITLVSCSKSTEMINPNKKFELTFSPNLEYSTMPISRAYTEQTNVYAIIIEKVIDGEVFMYSGGIFENPSLMRLMIDKGQYNIYCTVIDKKYVHSYYYDDPFSWNIDNLNTFYYNTTTLTNLKTSILNSTLYESGCVELVNSNRWYGEAMNVFINKDTNVDLNMKYMVFGIKLIGANIGDGNKLVMHLSYSLNTLTVKDSLPEMESYYTVKGNLSEWYNNDMMTMDITCSFYINEKTHLLSKTIPIKRKELTTFKVDPNSINISLEDTTFNDGNIYEY